MPVVDDDDTDTSKPIESPTVKKEPTDDTTATAAAVQLTGASGVQLLYHEPFDVSIALPLETSAVVPAVPHQVLTCRYRFSVDSVARRSTAISRTRSSLAAAVTSDSDTEEEGESGEQQSVGGGRGSSSRHAAVDASSTPAFLPPHVPVFYDVQS